MNVCLTVLAALLTSLVIHCQGSRINLNPTTLTLNHNQTYGTVVITCQPPANIKSLLALSIKRGVDQYVGSYNSGDSAPTLGYFLNGATITGGNASNSITVTMSQAACLDAGVYRCDATYRDSQDALFKTSSSDRLTVNASPGQITLTPDPHLSIYPNGSNLTLTCNGSIGSEDVQWNWEYKDPGAEWSANISQSENDISTDPPLSINSCQKNQVTRLTRVLTTNDDGRTYRCYVRRGNFYFDQYAAEYLIQKVGSQGQVSGITLNPTTLTLTNNQTYGTVVITCQPPADANIKSLLYLSINRSTNSIVDQNVGLYEKGDSVSTVNPSISGATITGGGASNSITVNMSQTSCTDAGVYTCDVTFIDPQNNIHSTSSSDNLTVKASPGQITLTPDPHLFIYPNGSTLTLTCNGSIGSEDVQWIWEYKDPGAGWSAYIPQSENGISTDPPSSILNSCQKTQVTRLTRVLTTNDDGKTYRCYVRRGNFYFDQYAAEYLIQKVGSQEESNCTQENPWKIAVIAMGVVIFVVCALSAVYTISGKSLSNFMRCKPVTNQNVDLEPVIFYNNATPEDGLQIYNEIAESAEGLDEETKEDQPHELPPDYLHPVCVKSESLDEKINED